MTSSSTRPEPRLRLFDSWRKADRWLLLVLKGALVAGVVVLEGIVLLAIARLLLDL